MLAIANCNRPIFSARYSARMKESQGITADRLRLAMDEAGIDQPELARLAGCTQGAISQILLGNTRRSRFLPAVAEAVGVDVNWLLGKTERRKSEAPKAWTPRDETVRWVLAAALSALPEVRVSGDDLPAFAHGVAAGLEAISSQPSKEDDPIFQPMVVREIYSAVQRHRSLPGEAA